VSTAGETASACQTPEVGEASCDLPWSEDVRAEDKTRIWRFVCHHPEGVNLPYLAAHVFGRGTDMGGADGRLLHRLVEGHPDYFNIVAREPRVVVEPTSASLRRFSLSANKQDAKHGDGAGIGVDVPKSNAEGMVRRWQTVETDGKRGELLGALAAKREATEDVFSAFERVRGSGPEHVLVPYRTQFNAPGRVADQRERFEGVWREAAGEHEEAVMVTLTTDPWRHESIEAAVESITEGLNRLKSYLGSDRTQHGLGHRPPSLVVREWSEESGLIHLHVVFFGVSWVMPHGALKAYWSDNCGHGANVWFDQLSTDGSGAWRWKHPRRAHRKRGDVGRRSPREYLGKVLTDLRELASASVEEVHEAAGLLRRAGREDAEETPGADVEGERGVAATDAEEGHEAALSRAREWSRLALYWATDTRIFTVSPVLKPEGEEDAPTGPDGEPLPRVTCYRYVGTARFEDFPAYVTRDAVVVRRKRGRPPPNTPNGPHRASARGEY
jgi:hypothetical protein